MSYDIFVQRFVDGAAGPVDAAALAALIESGCVEPYPGRGVPPG